MSEPEHSVLVQEETCVKRSPNQVTVDMLPDDVLLEIFDFYKDDHANRDAFTWRWIILIQVCRRWRHLILGSPRRLDLQLVCGPETPTRRLLDFDFWPPLPIVFSCPLYSYYSDMMGDENLIAALERGDRTSQIYISDIDCPELQKLIAVMDKPYSILRTFSLMASIFDSEPVLPKTFLGGSAPSLRSLSLKDVQFPTFPEFILSSNHIVSLSLCRVGYFSPEVMAGCLAVLPKLSSFLLESKYPLSHTFQKTPPPLTRAALPALDHFSFDGSSQYFEALVSHIDTPILKRLFITLSIPALKIPRLHGFVDCIESLGPFHRAVMDVSYEKIEILLGLPTRFKLAFLSQVEDWSVSSMTQVFSQQLRLLSHVKTLRIQGALWQVTGPAIDSSLLLELFRLFISVRSLCVSANRMATVTTALKELTVEGAMEVFPALCTLYLEGFQSSGSVKELIDPFVTSRQLSGHPVVIKSWEQHRSGNKS